MPKTTTLKVNLHDATVIRDQATRSGIAFEDVCAQIGAKVLEALGRDEKQKSDLCWFLLGDKRAVRVVIDTACPKDDGLLSGRAY
jgi:hypothetical protein